MLLAPGATLALAQDQASIEAPCLCKLGNREAGYRGTIAVTDANRDALRALIERRALSVGMTVTMTGAGCSAAAWPHERNKPACGQTSVRQRAADGTTSTTMIDNAEFTGTVRVRIFANAGIPRGDDAADGSPRVNVERWARVRSISVLGDVQ